MTALAAQHLRKAFGPQTVLDDASLSIDRKEKVALIGANGTGKSTLARILAGDELPDGGSVSVRRGLTIRYLAQEPLLDPNASARAVVEDALAAWRAATVRHAEITAALDRGPPTEQERLIGEQAAVGEAIERLGGWERGHEALGFLHKLGVRDVDRPCGSRSGGERRRIALAQLLVASPDIAILDEPTNHLDADTAEWLEDHLANEFLGAILLVTHDRYFLDAVVQRIVELERGRLSSFPGGYSDYLAKKAELMAHEERAESNRQNILRREREWLARGPKARATKQKARIQRAVAMEAQGPVTAGRPGEVTLTAASSARQGKTILELRAVQVAPAGARPLNEPFDLIVTAGERIGIVGPNGVGKTTLLRAILAAAEEERAGARGSGESWLSSGEIQVGKRTRVAYLDQTRNTLDDAKSIFDDVRGEGGTTVHLGAAGSASMDLRSYLELFLFDPAKQRQKVGSLSGGERARVALAKVLREGANLLVFDEPTNDLDLPTLAALEGILESFDGCVLVVTHDRAFLDRVATSILAFDRGPDASGEKSATVTRYAGGYQDYVVQRSRGIASAPAAVTSRRGPAPAEPKVRPKSGLTHAERLELEGLMAAVDTSEKAATEIETLLGDPNLYETRRSDVAALQSQLDAARARTAVLLSRWEALETKKGA
jgi:ABC transport system ATP-binding/permease protein